MKEQDTQCIKVEDIEAPVFKVRNCVMINVEFVDTDNSLHILFCTPCYNFEFVSSFMLYLNILLGQTQKEKKRGRILSEKSCIESCLNSNL